MPRINFQDNFAPVVNNTILETILTLKAVFDWEMAVLDVETTFLYKDLKEDDFMELLPGFFSFNENISDKNS